jgi:hypothetical protein
MLSFIKLLTFIPITASTTKNVKLEENNEIISNLKFIGKIKAGEQINIESLSICSRNMFSGFYRKIYGESRERTFHYFSLIIKRAFEKIQVFMISEKVSDKMMCTQLITNLYGAIDGLNNLKETYKEDRGFLCDLETLIEYIESKLEELKLSKPDYFKNVKQREHTIESILI